MAHESLGTTRERRLSRVRSLFFWPPAGGELETESETASAVSDWTGPTYSSRAARRVSFLDVQDPREPSSDFIQTVRNAHHRLSVPPVLDFLAPSGNNWNTMSVRSRRSRSKTNPPPLDIPEDAIAGPSSSVATLPLPPLPHDPQGKSQLFKRVLRRHGSFGSIRTFAVFSSRPGDRSSVESTYSSADSEHSLSGTTAYSPSDYDDYEKDKGKEVIVIGPDAEEEQGRRPVLVTPMKPDYAFEGCDGLLELDRETNEVLSHLTPPRCPSFSGWDPAPQAEILDIGCMFGDWAIQAATVWPFTWVTGVDVNSRWDALSGERVIPANVKFKQHDFLHNLPFEDNSFNYVRIANCQFRVKVEQWEFLLSEVHRVLRFGGRFELINEEFLSPDTSHLEKEQDEDEDRDEPRSMDAKMQRNCQELETIFRHALHDAGLDPSQTFDKFVDSKLQSIFGSDSAQKHEDSPMELCASMLKRKSNKFFGAHPQREQFIVLRRGSFSALGPRRLSLDPRYALHGPDSLFACQDFIHSFVAQQLDAEGAPLVTHSELDEAFWDYESFRERRFLWRSERHRAGFDDDADLIVARSRPGPRRSDGGDTGSMVGSMRRAFERTNSASSDTRSLSLRRTLERSYSFDADATPRPTRHRADTVQRTRWAPGEAYEPNENRALVPMRRFMVYCATKDVYAAPLCPAPADGSDTSSMQDTESSAVLLESSLFILS